MQMRYDYITEGGKTVTQDTRDADDVFMHSDANKAGMLVHAIGSAIAELKEMPQHVLCDNLFELKDHVNDLLDVISIAEGY